MKVKLNEDYTVCLDGIRPSSFKAGEEVDMPIGIAQVLLEDGRASAPKDQETKTKGGSPENKMEKEPEKNKGRRK